MPKSEYHRIAVLLMLCVFFLHAETYCTIPIPVGALCVYGGECFVVIKTSFIAPSLRNIFSDILDHGKILETDFF